MAGILQSLISALAGVVKDVYFKYVTLLLPGNGTNGAQNNTFLDSSSNNFTITRNGNTTQGTFTPFGSNWSNYFNGSADYLSAAANNAFVLDGSFTVEAWIFLTALPALDNDSKRRAAVASYYQSGSSAGYEFAVDLTNNVLNFIKPQSAIGITGSYTFSIGVWYHVAVTYNGSTGALYVNGTSLSLSVNNWAWVAPATPTLKVGALLQTNYPHYFPGNISNFRLVKGSVLYTGNFTPPTSPLNAVTNTSLLTCQSNRFLDNSSNAFAITAAGTPSVQRFSPFSPSAAYSTSVIGGSAYFDGNGDYITTAANSVFQPGTGAFTLEAWFYSLASGGGGVLGAIPDNSTSLYGFIIIGGASPQAIIQTNSTVAWAASVTVPINTWVHTAFVRDGSSNIAFFVNGVKATPSTGGATNTTSITRFDFLMAGTTRGDNPNRVGQFFTGYTSSSRYSKGTALYDPTQSTITVPTAPFSAGASTSLLLNYTNAGIIDNAMMNDAETVGNAQISTTQSKFGGSSMYFDGTGDWLLIADKPPLRIGTSDFTIEGWFYLAAVNAAYGIVSKGTSTTGWSVNITSGNNLQFSYTSSNLTGSTTLSVNTWYYFAVVRSGSATGNLKIYLNGSVDATSAGAVNDNFNQTNSMYVGADRAAGSALNGYIDDLRITNGYARTISSSPTSAFPVQ